MLATCRRHLGLSTVQPALIAGTSLSGRYLGWRSKSTQRSAGTGAGANDIGSDDATLLHLGASRKMLIAGEKSVGITSRKLPTSLKKLGNLARQIAHKPVSHAVLQMRFSDKRHAPHIASVLENARRGAVSKGMDEDSLFVDQAWVTKGKYVKRLWIKGRARLAIQRRPRVGIDIQIRDRTTADRRAKEALEKKQKKVLRGLTTPNRALYNSTVFTA